MGLRVAVAGASGYAGGELLRLLSAHPDLDVVVTMSGVMLLEDLRDPGHFSNAETTVMVNLLGTIRVLDAFTPHLIAQGHGFRTYSRCVEGSIVNYENVDNHQTGIHDYFKFLKFGFGRATDLACLHLRRGRLTRRDALELVRIHDGKFPWTYLGKDLADILRPLSITVDEFTVICDRFTNKKLFVRDARGALVRDSLGNLKKINDDNE